MKKIIMTAVMIAMTSGAYAVEFGTISAANIIEQEAQIPSVPVPAKAGKISQDVVKAFSGGWLCYDYDLPTFNEHNGTFWGTSLNTPKAAASDQKAWLSYFKSVMLEPEYTDIMHPDSGYASMIYFGAASERDFNIKIRVFPSIYKNENDAYKTARSGIIGMQGVIAAVGYKAVNGHYGYAVYYVVKKITFLID